MKIICAMFQLKAELSKVVAEVLYEMLSEILEGIDETTLTKKVFQQLSEELLTDDFACEVERELMHLLEEKKV